MARALEVRAYAFSCTTTCRSPSGRVVHVADAIGRTEYDTFAAVLVVPRSRVTACPGG